MNKNPHRQRRRLSVVGLSLLLVAGAACGSDSESETSEVVSEVSSAVSSEVSSAISTADTIGSDESTDTTAASETSEDAAETMDTIPAATASDDREAIIEYLGNIASEAGFELDDECVSDLVAQLSDEDAALLGESARNGGGGDPGLSAEGEALGNEMESCAIVDTATTTG